MGKNISNQLERLSIKKLFDVDGSEKLIFEIPIYQRNYAWEKDEITALVQDIYDSYKKNLNCYYIGTLVTYHKGDNVFEVIDGQQRLTTICLLLSALGDDYKNKLTYRARKKSDNTIKYIKEYKNDETQNSGKIIKQIPSFDLDDKDIGIINGYKYIEEALKEIVTEEKLSDLSSYFKEKVHIIHYQVPKDIDLNHYFEIMNSRGEQLEKHEIVKAELMSKLDDNDKKVFSIIWDACFEMGIYIQQNFKGINVDGIFGNDLSEFIPNEFDDLQKKLIINNINNKKISINKILESNSLGKKQEKDDIKDKFQPIIDFPNFLLIVLKITLMNEDSSTENQSGKEENNNVILDDKELLKEFNKITEDKYKKLIKKFAFNLLKSRFYLDNYIVHLAKDEDLVDKEDSNPWKLQKWYKGKNEESNKTYQYLKNLTENELSQSKLRHLLSMFEVSYSAKQRKNYLFYILYYLVNKGPDINDYTNFVKNLADSYFYNIYLNREQLNDSNKIPKADSFDNVIIKIYNVVDAKAENKKEKIKHFTEFYGDGINKASTGIPLFIFNYLDYKIWKQYEIALNKDGFLKELVCNNPNENSEIELSKEFKDVFNHFYFSRTRRSLEHFYPQAKAVDDSDNNHQIKAVDNSETQSTETDNNSQNNVDENNRPLTKTQINCFGNYAMIGSEANSSGSNWDPKTKVVHYRDKKINRVGVASLKFWIMMEICDKKGWTFEQIQNHQKNMLDLLSEGTTLEETTTSSQDCSKVS